MNSKHSHTLLHFQQLVIDLRRVFPSLRPRKNILNTPCSFISLINIRNKKMKSWTHPASPASNKTRNLPPCHLTTLPPFPPCHLTTLLPFPTCHLTTLPPLWPCYLTILSPFPLCHLTTLIHLSNLHTSLLSHLSQLTTLPTTNRSIQNSNVLPLGRQDKQGDFCGIYNTKNIIKEKICFKNCENPTCIDLILTNRPRSFQDSTVIETGCLISIRCV